MFVYDGSLTRDTDKQGLYVYRLDPESYRMELVQKVAVSSPCYLAFSPDQTRLYAASRQNSLQGRGDDFLAAYALDRRTGRLELLNTAKTPLEPSYLSVDPSGRFAAFACAYTGMAGVATIEPDGRLSGQVHAVAHEGTSVMGDGREPKWWKGVEWPSGTPFPHSARFSPDSRILYVPDIGLNRVMAYRLDPDHGRLEPHDPPWAEGAPLVDPRLPPGTSHWKDPRGAGPRHLEFHPNGRWLYVVNEVGSSVSVFDHDAALGVLTRVQDITTLPDAYRDFNMTADIHVHPNGRFVYATNRGHNSLAAYAIDADRGTLTSIGFTPTGGDFPRTFVIAPDGSLLLAGNMLSDSVSVFVIDPESGRLAPTGVINHAPAPSCLLAL